MEDNLCAVLYGKGDLRLTCMPVQEVKAGEVKIAMKNCGLCMTDVHLWTTDLAADQEMTMPIILGHESSGVVVECGPGVSNLKPGDRVALELGLPCRTCEFCKLGRYNLCKPFSLNALARYMVYAADFCHKIPEDMSYEAAALCEPLAVGVRAGSRAGVSLGSKVLICGAGAIGLSSMLTVKSMGAAKICVTDLSEERLALAQRMGGDRVCTLLVTRNDLQNEEGPRILAAKVKALLGDQPQYTIETSGAEASLQMAIYATKSGGCVAPVGLDPPEVRLPIVDAAVREVDIKGVFSYCNNYPAVIGMVSSGVDPTPMITHRFDLEQTLEAFELVKSQAPGVLKVMINCDSSKS